MSNYKPSEDALAEHLRRLFTKHSIQAVFDVGANDGAYALMLRNEVGYKGAIHSFEPIPEKVRELEIKAKNDKLWEIHNFALGAYSGKETFHVMSSDVFSSFRKPFEGQPNKYNESNRIASAVEVEVRTAAEVIGGLGVSRVHLKMDTQGFDLEVFAGAVPVLSDIITLQSELSFQRIYEGAPMWDVALERFTQAGYKVSFMLPISLDGDFGCIEADGVFVKSGSNA